MYCINCGVELADSEKKCPLCNTHVFHPQLSRSEDEQLYPSDLSPVQQVRPWGLLLIISMCFLLPISITLLCDLQISGAVTWSGYVVGGLLVAYVMLVLPYWFHRRRRNPVIFVPCSFLAIGLYLLYIDLATGGNWFLTFALPVTGASGLIVTAIVALTRYIRRGRLYIYGGAAIVTAACMPIMELLLNYTFHRPRFLGWSLYPLIALMLIGITMLIIAVCRPLRQSLEKRFFL